MDFKVIEPLISQTYSSVQSLYLFKLSAIQLMKKSSSKKERTANWIKNWAVKEYCALKNQFDLEELFPSQAWMN